MASHCTNNYTIISPSSHVLLAMADDIPSFAFFFLSLFALFLLPTEQAARKFCIWRSL